MRICFQFIYVFDRLDTKCLTFKIKIRYNQGQNLHLSKLKDKQTERLLNLNTIPTCKLSSVHLILSNSNFSCVVMLSWSST